MNPPTIPYVILTGAGISADSNIPTFRGRDGLWNSYRVEELATPQAFKRNPERVWAFYHWRRERIWSAQPNTAHEAVAALQRRFPSVPVITQNVDGLHQRAGSRHVIELHGSLWKLRCCRCSHRWEDVDSRSGMPTCPQCGALARPDVVWFGENLASDRLDTARAACTATACLLIIGTAGLVYPAAGLPMEAKRSGAILIEFNLEKTALTPGVDRHVAGRAAETLPRWWAQQEQNSSPSSSGE